MQPDVSSVTDASPAALVGIFRIKYALSERAMKALLEILRRKPYLWLQVSMNCFTHLERLPYSYTRLVLHVMFWWGHRFDQTDMRNAITGYASELRNKSKTPNVEKTVWKWKSSLEKRTAKILRMSLTKNTKNGTRTTRRANPERNPSAPTVNDFFCLNRNCWISF